MEGSVRVKFDLKKLKALMVLKGDSRAQIANYLNLSEINLCNKLNGRAAFSHEEILSLLKEIIDNTNAKIVVSFSWKVG